MKNIKYLQIIIASSFLASPLLTIAEPFSDTKKENFATETLYVDPLLENGSKEETIVSKGIFAANEPAIVLSAADYRVVNKAVLRSKGLNDTVSIVGRETTFSNQKNGQISSDLFGVSARGENNTVNNSGTITGDVSAINFDVGSSGALNNFKLISSSGRAVHVAGEDVRVFNDGEILGSGDQIDGTLYLDAHGERISVLNNGVIDAGTGNNGAGVSLQIGDEEGDSVNVDLVNSGAIRGQGVATEGTLVGDAVRIFSVLFEETVASGNIINHGDIVGSTDSNIAVAISIENNVELIGSIINHGRISGTETAIDGSGAGGSISIRNDGEIDGDVILSRGNDIFRGGRGSVNGVIDAGSGDDRIFGGRNSDLIIGGAGSDRIFGGRGIDTVSFANRSREDFIIQPRVGSSSVTVIDNVSGEIDILTGVEIISFSDEELDLKSEFPSIW